MSTAYIVLGKVFDGCYDGELVYPILAVYLTRSPAQRLANKANKEVQRIKDEKLFDLNPFACGGDIHNSCASYFIFEVVTAPLHRGINK